MMAIGKILPSQVYMCMLKDAQKEMLSLLALPFTKKPVAYLVNMGRQHFSNGEYHGTLGFEPALNRFLVHLTQKISSFR